MDEASDALWEAAEETLDTRTKTNGKKRNTPRNKQQFLMKDKTQSMNSTNRKSEDQQTN